MLLQAMHARLRKIMSDIKHPTHAREDMLLSHMHQAPTHPGNLTQNIVTQSPAHVMLQAPRYPGRLEAAFYEGQAHETQSRSAHSSQSRKTYPIIIRDQVSMRQAFTNLPSTAH